MSKSTTGRKLLDDLEKRVAELERDHQQLKSEVVRLSQFLEKALLSVENA